MQKIHYPFFELINDKCCFTSYYANFITENGINDNRKTYSNYIARMHLKSGGKINYHLSADKQIPLRSLKDLECMIA